jgi:transposase
MPNRKLSPSDASDEEWAFAAPYLALVREDAPQRTHDLREVLNGLRWVVRTGSAWRYMPHDLPPWEAVYQQTRRWLVDSRILQSTPESGRRAGYDGAKRKKGTKVHVAVDTLGHLLALHLTPANEHDREQIGELAQAIQEGTGESVELA